MLYRTLAAYGHRLRAPTLVLFDGQVRPACGTGQSAMGPFYCPNDEKLYLDLSFFSDLQTRFRAPGDFAQAYVIAHEVGHPIQKLTGTMNQLDAGDAAEALAAATAIGDDRLQKQTQGRVVPESFTHGSSEQRVRWFKRGLDTGQVKACDTFSAATL